MEISEVIREIDFLLSKNDLVGTAIIADQNGGTKSTVILPEWFIFKHVDTGSGASIEYKNTDDLAEISKTYSALEYLWSTNVIQLKLFAILLDAVKEKYGFSETGRT